MGYEIVARTRMSEEELEAVLQLVQVCNEHDGIDLKVNPDMLRSRRGTETEDFLCYQDDRLVGFLGLYVFHGEEAEVSGMVHPDYRRKGIFRALQNEAARVCRERKIPQHCFIVQRESGSGKSFAEQLGAVYSFSEYWMDLAPDKKAVLPPPSIQLRAAGPSDLETLIWLDVHGFQMEEEKVREMHQRINQNDRSTTYLILADHQPIGKISTMGMDKEGFIYGFCVHPEHQGKGYGRQALAQAIDILLEEGMQKVSLEVACENSNALGLYESCGFVVKSANDYYKLTL
ncbi:GNAT family N-acetyltransferase [Brevibacillus panacihumi]|uniref:GNAT family N-acetyltransferase n=1 Tax=Brevibacillus panacihumi TaxID=497735 RepID=A0A3M8DE58_9BACL|nr:GNAT family N-acetyltransferase [Brevibacillus panacihumi]RNB86298.1 GNAT family N-acetyltransferase [Brevibacillus panacihumi]